jgi:hypothetical protein
MTVPPRTRRKGSPGTRTRRDSDVPSCRWTRLQVVRGSLDQSYRPRWEAGVGPSHEESGADVVSVNRRASRRKRGVNPDGFSKEILRKEVIQPQVPLRLPCYDLVPITGFTFGACLAAPATSDAPRFGGLTGGVYKAQEHIHRGMLIRDY